MADLTVAEELFILGFAPSGANLRPQSILEAGLAAAVLGELWLRRRVELDQGMVVVCDATPTGDGLLDRVLTTLVAHEPAAPFQWLRNLGPDVITEVASRLQDRDMCQLLGHGSVRWIGDTDVNRGLRQATRRAAVAALNGPDGVERTALLGTLLWATELTGESFRIRWRLGRAAGEDWLAQAVHQATGRLHPPDPASHTWVAAEPSAAGPPRVRPWWRRRHPGVLVALAVGCAMIAAPYLIQHHVSAQATSLRAQGTETRASVVQRSDTEDTTSKGGVIRTATVLITYEYQGRRYEWDVRCERGCRNSGDSIRIWVDPADPYTFVTEWGDSSRSGPFTKVFSQLLTYVGFGVVGLAALIIVDPPRRVRRWTAKP